MGSTSFLSKPKSASYRTKSGSSAGSDKEMNVKLKRSKIRRPAKMNEFGIKRIPDYTEMAHKEAVSKLKYFLCGNAPSIRSYGGSASIKNLDESDGDLDKKYSTSYNTLSEYKPRPRLTAKYATLYADSLKNYTPPQPITANAPQGDLSGGTNPDVVNFIQKQEEYIEQLERESQYCRDELNNLLGKVKEVISENENLHEAQKNKIISKMFHSYAGSETDDLDDIDSTGLDSDNKVSPSKHRKPRSRSTKLEGPNIVFESRIAELEAQLTQSKIDLKKVQDENNENKRKLANGLVDSTCLDGFKRQIDNLQRDKSTLESQISKLKLSLEQREGDFDSRSKKGSDIIEQQLREERNNLEIEIRRLKDELSSERNKTRSLAGEGARRAVAERSAAEQRYTTHCDQLQRDLATQYDYAAKLQLDLERQRREENDLKRDISMKGSAIEELKMELKNKTASLQADLAQAHAEKAALEEELASARLAIERQQRQAKHETNRLNSEIQSLRQRLDRADADLVHSRRENLRLSEQISTLERELNMKNLTPMTPEKKGKDKELSTMLESMENKHAKTVAELESMIQSQNSLMEKLTGECRLLTDKLDDANRRHKKELATLQRQVDHLGRSLQSPHPPSNYQAPSTHAAATTRIPNTPTDERPDYTGTQSTGDTSLGHHDRIGGNSDTYQARDINDDVKEQVADNSYHQDKPAVEFEQTPKPENKNLEQPSQDVTDTEPIQMKSSEDIVPDEIITEHEEQVQEATTVNNPEYDNLQQNGSHEANKEKQQEKLEHVEQSDISEEKQPEQYENSKYPEGEYPNYEQNYEQQEYSQQPEYTEQQEYSEQPAYIEQQGYTEEQEYTEQQGYNEQPQYTEQYENYEQYPQQYTDPNPQYEGQEGYENYATDGNYSEQNYENQQLNQEYTPQYPEPVTEQTESNESKTPNENVVSQS